MKTTDHVLRELPDLLAGSTTKEAKARIKRHLKRCKACREEFNALASVWTNLGLLPEELPGPRVREKFYEELALASSTPQVHQAQSGRFSFVRLIEHLWPKQPAFQIAIAVVCLLVGYVVGFRIDGGTGGSGGDVAQLRSEVQTMKRLVMMSLLKTESASDRIKGVSWSETIARPDEDVLSALFERLNFDLNVNVRLAALDALSRLYDQPTVREALLSSLLRQTSPFIQFAMVEVITDAHDRKAVDVLKQLLANRELNKTVREQVEKRLKDLGT